MMMALRLWRVMAQNSARWRACAMAAKANVGHGQLRHMGCKLVLQRGGNGERICQGQGRIDRDGALNRMQLLGQIHAGAPRLDHGDDRGEIAVGAFQALDNVAMRGMLPLKIQSWWTGYVQLRNGKRFCPAKGQCKAVPACDRR